MPPDRPPGRGDLAASWQKFCETLRRKRHSIAGRGLRRRRPIRRLAPTPCNGEAVMTKIDKSLETELEAAAFRRLVRHLRERSDVQNIDLMNLSGFCRNCLANWYQEAAKEKGLDLTKDGAREVIYGMPYKDWQAKHQKEASAEQQAAFAKAPKHQH